MPGIGGVVKLRYPGSFVASLVLGCDSFETFSFRWLSVPAGRSFPKHDIGFHKHRGFFLWQHSAKVNDIDTSFFESQYKWSFRIGIKKKTTNAKLCTKKNKSNVHLKGLLWMQLSYFHHNPKRTKSCKTTFFDTFGKWSLLDFREQWVTISATEDKLFTLVSSQWHENGTE